MTKANGIIYIDIRVRNLPCDNVHECTIWMRGILQGPINIKCVGQALAVSLVCLDSTLIFLFMMSVMTILFSVTQRSNTLRYLPADCKAKGPLRHMIVICSHPYCSSFFIITGSSSVM